MALPRYLYSINTNSIRTPLLEQDHSEQEIVESENTEAEGSARAEGSDRFTDEVRLSSPELYEPKSDIYTSARLAAAGISDPLIEEEKQLLAVSDHVFVNNPEGKEGFREQYGTNDGLPLKRRRSRPPSSSSDGFVCYVNDKKRTKHEDAALYVREGEDNDKFDQHPRGKWSKRAYQALHSSTYHVFNLCVCTLILLLALIEHPSLATQADLTEDKLMIIVVVHALLEIVLLAVIWLDMLLRFFWFRPKYFFTHKRTIFILVVLVVMSVEAIVVLARQDNHFRITRALRPIFFIDTYLMGGVRRVLRQIFLCIKPILDVLILLILSLLVFSLLGFLIFADTDTTYFVSFNRSIVSFFITLTTANDPNSFMEAYARQPASPIFFIVYIIVMVYFISNVLLAVVYSSFSEADKNKFKKLFLHKRDALRQAYYVLESTPGRGIEFQDFLLFMHYYQPRVPEWQVMCMFKVLHKDPTLHHKDLSLEEFYGFYEMRDFRWKRVRTDGEELTWFEHCHPIVKSPAKVTYKVVKSPWFNIVINIVLITNLIFLVVYTLFITEEEVKSRYYKLNQVVAVSLVFVSIYLVEICLRLFANGPMNYFRKPRNIIDFLIILTSFVLLVVETINPAFSYLAVFRPIKFIRLLRLKRRYRDIMNTLVVLSRRLISVGILLLIVYYSFSIIGMEFFSDKVHENCCNESLYGVGEYYSGNNRTFTPNVYYLLNFNNMLRSYVTLFVLMVVNNWYIIMEGFASTSKENGWLIRLYFMAFYIITLVMLQVIISFIVEAFVFRIQTVEKKRQCDRHPGQHCDCHKANERKKMVTINLLKEDIDKLKYEMTYSDEKGRADSLSQYIRHCKRVNLDELTDCQMLTYSGRRLRTKDDIYLWMYRSDLTNWIQERDKELEQFDVVTPKKQCLKILCGYITNCVRYIIE